ncbi:MAG: winged helix-turn-helix domain-containing protein [Bacteroidota bacterium]
MKWLERPNKQSILPIYQQIKGNIISAVEDGTLKTGEKIPSINKLCSEFGLAPGTVIRAYEELREMGLISSKQGKGYFILNTHYQKKTRVFLLFDRMNAYKEILYDAILQNLGHGIEVDVFFHHYALKRFEKLIRENLGRYSYFVVLPHFNQDVSRILSRIPEKKLIVLDKSVPGMKGKYAAIYQDFEKDVYNGLKSQLEKISGYKRIVFSSSKSSFQFVPEGCITGFTRFCADFHISFEIVSKLYPETLQPETVYFLYSDSELIALIREIENRKWIPGREIGIVSYDETPMKEILAGGISVLTTDFIQMGTRAAGFINGQPFCQEANPSRFIVRSSI